MAAKGSTVYNLIKFPGLAVLWVFGKMIKLMVKEPPFYDPADFPWAEKIEANFVEIKQELEELLKRKDSIPNLQDIFKEQAQLTEGEDWKSFMMYLYDYKFEKNCDLCPQTDAFLKKIPGMRTAMFSILAPGKHIPAHKGPFKGVLRYHLGLVIPKSYKQCGIRVSDQTRHWQEGKSLILDDNLEHEAWNNSDEYRAILFVDFKRDFPFPLAQFSELLYQGMRRSPFIRNVIKSQK